MVTLVIPNTVQIAINATCSGQDVVNVIHLRYGTGISPSSVTILGQVKTAWEGAGGPLQYRPSSLLMVGYHYTDLNSLTGAVGYLASNKAGNATPPIATMAASALIQMGGGQRNRSSSGRMYHGPLVESQVASDGRTIEPLTSGQLNASYQKFKTDLAAVGLEWVVASRKYGQANPVATVSCSTVIATQRRRLR